MATAIKKETQKTGIFYVHCLIGFALMFGTWFLPPIDPITPVGMQVLGIFLGLIYCWTFVGSLWPSLLGIVAMGLSDYMTIEQAVAGSFGNTNALVVLFTLILFGAVEKAGIAQYIARWFLTRKIINGRPMVFSFIFILGTYILASLIGPVAGLLIMWPIIYTILQQVGYKAGDRYSTVMVIGTFIGAVAGQGTIPFKSSPLVILSAFEAVSGVKMDYLAYIGFALIMSVLTILGYLFLTKLIIRPDMTLMKNINTADFDREPLPKMTKVQTIYFTVMWLYIVVLLLPNILPLTLAPIKFISTIGVIGVTLLFIVILAVLKVNGQPIFNFKAIAASYITWDIYFLVASAMVVSMALTAPDTGIKEFIVTMLNPLLGGRTVLIFSIILIVFSILITNIAANAVMGIILMPIIFIFAINLGANPIALAAVVTLSLHVAILTPAASPVAAILHGNSDWVKAKDVYQYCGIVVGFTLLLYTIIGLPLANLIF